MKPTTINQEVLLLAGTSFSKKQFCKKDKPHGCPARLQKACLSSMLFQMFPGLAKTAPPKTFAWEVIPAKTFILVKSGTATDTIENESSIYPYSLLSVKNFN